MRCAIDQSLLDQLFDNSPAAISYADNGVCFHVNDSFLTMFGYARKEIVGEHMRLVITPDERDRVYDFIHKSGKSGASRFATKGCRKNGGIFDLEIESSICKIGEREYSIAIHRDITDRKRAEDALTALSTRQNAILAAVPDIIAEVDENKVYTWLNKAGVDFFGKDAPGREAAFYFEGEQSTYAAVQPLFEGDTNVIYLESWQRRKDGAKRLLAWWCRVLKNANGMVNGALSTARDITEIRRAEVALAEEKERLAVTLRSIGDAVIATDTSGNVILMNRIAEEITGWESADVEGKPLAGIFRIVNEFSRQPCENPVEKVLSSGTVVGLANHTIIIRRDGREFNIADSGAPIRNKKGEIIGVVLVFRDVTGQVKTERALQNTQKLESLALLAGGIAHDFNNLLSGIFGQIDLAAAMVRDAAAAEHLAQALNTINRARGLTGQLLTFAKGGAPVKKFDRLTPLIQDTVKFALSGSNVSSYFTIAADLWQCEFDRSQISQTIDNIVLNGMQAMPEGGVIEIKAENIEIAKETPGTLCAGNYVKIAIKDHGIGMPKAILPKIFDPFFTTKAKGHGLGLATCHSIITRHGGAIEADSEPGKGSTLTIYLPASRQAGPTDAPNFVVPHKGGGLFLVMDDEAIIRETLRALLGRFGYTVSCASNAKEALELFEQRRREGNPFTALMMDLTIPGGPGGKEAILEIRKIDKNIPVFVSSGYADDPVMARPEAYGFTASICKPFMGGELAEMLNRHLGKASMAFPAT